MSTINYATRFINTNSQEYPFTLAQIRKAHSNVSIARNPTEDMLALLGYAIVQPTERPTGDVVTEGTPAYNSDEDIWEQTWEVRSYNQDELDRILTGERQKRLSEIQMLSSKTMTQGHPYEFSEGVIEHIQLRDGDRANLSGLRLKAEARIRDEDNTPLYFRTFEDNVYPLSPEEMIILSDEAFDAYTGYMAVLWDLKDQTKSAASVSEMPTIPETIELS